MRFIVLGTSEFTLRCAQALVDVGAKVCALVSMPVHTRPNNSADIEGFARTNRIHYQEIEDINSHESLMLLQNHSPDFIFVSWPQILKDDVLDVPENYCIGTHPTDLPYNRGRHPLHWLIALGISKTKLSFFRIDKGVDTGDILLQISFSISPSDSISNVVSKMNIAGYKGTRELYTKLLSYPSYSICTQDHLLANYWRKRTPHDVTLDLRMTAHSILRTIRSFASPYPCAKLIFENHVIKILDASPKSLDMRPELVERIEPGRIIRIEGSTISVKVDDGIIDLECDGKIPKRLLKANYIHPPSKYFMKWADEIGAKLGR